MKPWNRFTAWLSGSAARVRALTCALAFVLWIQIDPVAAMCTPVGGFPGAYGERSGLGAVLAGLGAVGPARPADGGLIALASGVRPGSAPACGAAAGGGSDEPASLPGDGPSRAAGNPFDVVTGAKHERVVDLEWPAVDTLTAVGAQAQAGVALTGLLQGPARVNLLFSRFYHSSSEYALSLGPGWTHSFETRLARLRLDAAPPAPGLPAMQLQVLQADGRRMVFRPQVRLAPRGARAGPVRYASADLSEGLIEEDLSAADHPWVWRWPSGRRLMFDPQGRLSAVVAPDLDALRLAYDASGRLETVRDSHGRSLQLGYQSDRLAWVLLPSGERVRYSYDAQRRLVAVRYPDGQLITHHYEDARAPHRLTGTTWPDGRRSHHRYDEAGRVTSTRAPGDGEEAAVTARYPPPAHVGETQVSHRGGVTAYRWRLTPDSVPRLEAARGPGCPSCPAADLSLRHDASGRLVAFGAWRLTYDGVGRLQTLSRGEGVSLQTWRLFHDSADPLAPPARIEAPSVVAGRQRALRFRYNARGQMLELHESGWAPYTDAPVPLVRSLRFHYAVAGPVAGKLIAIEQLDGEAVVARHELHHDDLRRLQALRHPLGVAHRIERDALGRPVLEVLPDGSRRERRFEGLGRLARLFNGEQWLDLSRDDRGRLSSIAFSRGDRWSITERGSVIEIQAASGARVRLAQAVRADWADRIDQAARPGEPAVAHREALPTARAAAPGPVGGTAPALPRQPGLIALGLVLHADSLRLLDADGRLTELVHDDFGRLIEERSAQRGLSRHDYDALGRPMRISLSDGSQQHLRFDAAGRLTEREQVSGEARLLTRLGYQGTRLVAIEHPWQSTDARYDADGRLVSLEHRLAGARIAQDFTYDAAGRLVERGLGDGMRLRFGYDSLGRPSRLGLVLPDRGEPIWLVSAVGYRDGEAVDEQFGQTLRRARRADAAGRLERLEWRHARSDAELAGFVYRWGPTGLLASLASEAGEDRFAFDVLGRLIVRERHPLGRAVRAPSLADPALRSGAVISAEYFHYTPAGDLRVSRDAQGRTHRWAADAVDRLGRPLTHGPWRLHYGPSGRIERLERIDPADPGSPPSHGATPTGSRAPGHAYRYNALGERVSKLEGGPGETVRARHFLYHQQALAAELDSQGRITRHYIRWTGQVIAVVDMVPGDTLLHRLGWRQSPAVRISYLLSDHLGTPHRAVDERGRIVWQAEYGPYGSLLAERGSLDQPLRLPGQYHDRETGLHDNYQRSYDPARGRYLEPDPLGLAAGWSLHAYAAGNPLQASDPLGLILFAFDGTGNGDPARAPDTLSNVAKLFSLYSGRERFYMSGVGISDPASGIRSNALDGLDANSARQRVDYMLGMLERSLQAPEAAASQVPVDVIGFSRGAAMARDFANTVAARIRSGHYLSLGRCVALNFIGLWDTVAQFGLNGQANANWNLGIPSEARVAVHAVAVNEHRRFFPLESILPPTAPGSSTAPAPASGATTGLRIERGFIGDHGDVGGSHAQGDLSDVALAWMVAQARAAGLSLRALDEQWRIVSEPLRHDARSLLQPGPDREVRQRAESGAVAASSLQRDFRGAGLDWQQTLPMLRDYPYRLRGVDGAPSLAGEVDMRAYSEWLSREYGLAPEY